MSDTARSEPRARLSDFVKSCQDHNEPTHNSQDQSAKGPLLVKPTTLPKKLD
jgi:hypothetical protein